MVSALLAAAAALVVLIACGWVISTYNRLVALKNLCDNGFAQIEVQLRRRYDLIPNLVECVKGYMTHERQTLEDVIGHTIRRPPDWPKPRRIPATCSSSKH